MKFKLNLSAISSRALLAAAFICLIFNGLANAQPALRKALDYDADGKADFGVFRTTDSTWYISRSGGSTQFQAFGLASYDQPVPGDYDGDGKGDLAVWRYSDRVWYILASSTGTVTATTFGLVGDEPMQRDFDGDGKTDIAVVRRTSGNMIWYVLGSSAGFSAYQFGLSTDAAAPGDYDGDGKFDYAVHRPGAASGAQAYFYVRSSSTGGVGVFPWGLYGDVVVPGDYDGDGKTDAAVLRRGATNTIWYVLKSSDASLLALTFGLTEQDFPVQNDYDGDGRTDIAMWRETDGNYYVFRSSDAAVGVVSWGWASDLPLAGYDAH